MPRTIYFDYNATTPLDPAVRDVMLPFLGEIWGNPSSVHHVGRRARALLDEARERSANVLGCKPAEIIFTSGGTESNNLAVFGMARLLASKGRHLITSAIEHHAVSSCFDYLESREKFEVSRLPVDSQGRVSVEDLKQAIRPDTILVSIMAANNEIGTIQPVAELGGVCRAHGIPFHTDAVQWFGKEPFARVSQFNADLVSLCAHKFHGPKGAGLLYLKSPLHPHPIIFGGGHEQERRAGTENLAGIIGLVEAMERFIAKPVFERNHLEPLSRQLIGLRRCRGTPPPSGTSPRRGTAIESWNVLSPVSASILVFSGPWTIQRCQRRRRGAVRAVEQSARIPRAHCRLRVVNRQFAVHPSFSRCLFSSATLEIFPV